LSFVYYIEHGRLVSYEQVQAILCDDTGQHVGRMYAILGACDVEESCSSFHYRCLTTSLEYAILLEN
jgi:hypothetical protein